jgi:streptogramin lyase
MRFFASVAVASMLLALQACSSSSTSSTPPAPPRVYAAATNVTDVTFYTGPFASSTAPGGSVTGFTAPFGVAVDPTNTGNVFVSDTSTGAIAAYARPAPTTSVSLFTVVSGIEPGEITFDVAGNLYFTNFSNESVNKVAHPVASGSTPTALVTSGLNAPQCAAADSSGNLYVLDGSSTPHRVLMYAPPYTGVPIVTTSGMSTDTDPCAVSPINNMFFVGNIGGTILGFTTPLTAGEAPTVTLNSTYTGASGYAQFGFAFDKSGNLYVAAQNYTTGTLTSASISVYTGPTITSGETAAVTFPDVSRASPATIKNTSQLAVGF